MHLKNMVVNVICKRFARSVFGIYRDIILCLYRSTQVRHSDLSVTDHAVFGFDSCNNTDEAVSAQAHLSPRDIFWNRRKLGGKWKVLQSAGRVCRAMGFVHYRLNGRVKKISASLCSICIGYDSFTVLQSDATFYKRTSYINQFKHCSLRISLNISAVEMPHVEQEIKCQYFYQVLLLVSCSAAVSFENYCRLILSATIYNWQHNYDLFKEVVQNSENIMIIYNFSLP